MPSSTKSLLLFLPLTIMKINGESLHCEYGLISRDGWVVVQDHDNYVVNDNDWWDGLNTDQTDIYFFGHGLNYKQALKDYTMVGGKIAMVPKYITGIWWYVIKSLVEYFCSPKYQVSLVQPQQQGRYGHCQ